MVVCPPLLLNKPLYEPIGQGIFIQSKIGEIVVIEIVLTHGNAEKYQNYTRTKPFWSKSNRQ